MRKKRKTKSHVLFSLGHDGNWHRREWLPQCDEDILLSGECQGSKGHKGPHWCYRPDGSYAWDNNDKENPKPRIAGGWIPPGCKGYVHPEKKLKDFYLSHHKDSVVTNKKEIARLNAGKMRANESLTRPVDLEEYKDVVKRKRKRS